MNTPEVLLAPLARFDRPPEPWDALVAEAERNLERAKRLPPMVIGFTGDARLAVARADLTPEQLAAVEIALLGRPEVRWTATAGEMMLPHQGGALRHVFVRARGAEGRWRAAARPFLFARQGGLTWLGEWSERRGDAPEGPFLPAPAEIEVRFSQPD